VEAEATGFSRKMAKELEKYMKEVGVDGDGGEVNREEDEDEGSDGEEEEEEDEEERERDDEEAMYRDKILRQDNRQDPDPEPTDSGGPLSLAGLPILSNSMKAISLGSST